MHWNNKRTIPCTGDGCELCIAGTTQRWVGYAPALLWQHCPDEPKKSHWKPIVCPITEGMTEVLTGKDLTGLVIEVERPGRRHNGPIQCKIVDRHIQDPLPTAFDVVPILLRMWGFNKPQRPATPQEQADNDQQPDVIPFHRTTEDKEAAEG